MLEAKEGNAAEAAERKWGMRAYEIDECECIPGSELQKPGLPDRFWRYAAPWIVGGTLFWAAVWYWFIDCIESGVPIEIIGFEG